MAAHDKLTHNGCQKATLQAGQKRRTLSDGLGLKLNVTASSKLWRFDYTFQAKQRSLSLGRFPEVSLSEAREHRNKARRWLRDGRDPVKARQAERLQERENTFRTVAAAWLLNNQWSDGHRRTIEQRLGNHILPYLGNSTIDELTPPGILECVRRLEKRGYVESAHRVKFIIGQVCRFAISEGLAESDPTRDIRDALKTREPKTFAFIKDPAKLGAMLRAIEGYSGSPTVKAALQLLPMVFIRPGEHRAARWSEIDLDARMWVIPAKRMKVSKNGDHTVPLSWQAVAILRELYPLTGNDELVFPSLRSNARPISENTLNAALLRIDIPKDEHVPHGFRHTASTLLNELRFDADLVEAQLHHGGNGVRSIYNKASYIELRREMMQEWSDYLDRLKHGATVVKLETAS